METDLGSLEQLTTLAKAKGFLGREFLTWLWYTAETTRERLHLRLGPSDETEVEVGLWVDDRLVLDGSAAMAQRNVMKGGDPSHSLEAAVALSTGKTVSELRLGLGIKDGGEFSAVLSADDLNPRALRLPAAELPADAPEGAKPPAAPLAERIKATETFLAILDALFGRFLAARVEPDWESQTVKDMREWIRKRHAKRESDILH